MDGIIDAEKLFVVNTERLQYKYDQLLDQYEKVCKDLSLVADDCDRIKYELSKCYRTSEVNKKLYDRETERSELYEKIINFMMEHAE